MKKLVVFLVLIIAAAGAFAYLRPDAARRELSAILARTSSTRSPASAPAGTGASAPAPARTAPAAQASAAVQPVSAGQPVTPPEGAPSGLGAALAGALGSPTPPAAPPAASSAPGGTAVPAPVARTAGAGPAPSAAAAPIPWETTSFDLALADVGGHVDHISGTYGPGRLGTLLNDGRADTIWKPDDRVVFPVELVFSFYEREPVLVSAVAIDPPTDAALAPKDVEVWIAPPGRAGAFAKVAAQALTSQATEQRIEFPAADASQVKLRILSGQSPDQIAIGEVKLLEARRTGYTALLQRRPDIETWKGSPRRAAQLGLDWLEQAAPAWEQEHKCFGCHVQAQVMMGQAIARRNHYIVDEDAFAMLGRATRKYQEAYPPAKNSWFDGSVSATQFAAMALAYVHDAPGDPSKTPDPAFRGALDWLLTRQGADGSFPVDRDDPPIVQGKFMTSANTVFALMRAADRTGDAKYKAAADRALAWIASTEPDTTQDRVFKILALSQFGTPDQRRLIPPVVERLAADQQPDGGWKEVPRMEGSNALATGQVLYALRQSGTSLNSQVFRRAVGYLLGTQVRDTHTATDGYWKDTNTQSGRHSDFAPTMWAAIGLAGAYSAATTGGLDVFFDGGGTRPASRNLEIVLDASGSMKLPLGHSTRWQTALDVLGKLLDALPPGFNVAMRTYGHRYPSRSPQTCSDIELVVPIAPLNRDRVLGVARALRPRGETPLVRSVLAAPDDLRQAGGGSVVLITDGEESCHGDLKAAAATLKASGVDVRLNIVGFTLKGKTTEEQLGLLAAATGGRYYSAQSGDALARAVTLAALQELPFDVIGADGQKVVTAETGPVGVELPPGTYRVVVRAPGQELTQSVRVDAGRDSLLKVALRGDQFVFQQ